MPERVHPLWDEFIMWSRTPDAERGPVSTEEEWAASKGLTSRTLRRWKQSEAFAARRDQLLSRFGGVPVAEEADIVSLDSDDERSYLAVKSKLIDGAKEGNPKYLELYFKTYGKPFVEEELASRSGDLASEDLPALVAEALAAVGEDLVVAALRERGWDVRGPES